GGVGITYSSKASKSSRTPVVRDLVVRGAKPTSKAQWTTAGISIEGTSSPRIGPNVTISQLYWGIHVTGASAVDITASSTNFFTISNAAAECILVRKTTPPAPSLVL